ncbi:hypothetical protein B0H10DRAFT_419562 [Mycena sp. CBHHK59/15]|nr:hypothetical protein B0H10DRAFT_419562 [Mycena sp. CBHHK59/15]
MMCRLHRGSHLRCWPLYRRREPRAPGLRRRDAVPCKSMATSATRKRDRLHSTGLRSTARRESRPPRRPRRGRRPAAREQAGGRTSACAVRGAACSPTTRRRLRPPRKSAELLLVGHRAHAGVVAHARQHERPWQPRELSPPRAAGRRREPQLDRLAGRHTRERPRPRASRDAARVPGRRMAAARVHRRRRAGPRAQQLAAQQRACAAGAARCAVVTRERRAAAVDALEQQTPHGATPLLRPARRRSRRRDSPAADIRIWRRRARA